jgi:hypothetical protein
MTKTGGLWVSSFHTLGFLTTRRRGYEDRKHSWVTQFTILNTDTS